MCACVRVCVCVCVCVRVCSDACAFGGIDQLSNVRFQGFDVTMYIEQRGNVEPFIYKQRREM